MSEKKAATSGKNIGAGHVRGGYTPIAQPPNPRPPTGGTGESPRAGASSSSTKK